VVKGWKDGAEIARLESDNSMLPYKTQLMQMAMEQDNFIHQSTYISIESLPPLAGLTRRW
jgi:hypothetical protein